MVRKEPKVVSSWSVGYAYSFTSLDGSVTSVPYPFHPQMAKVQLSTSVHKGKKKARV
jgi:hypothetical protein